MKWWNPKWWNVTRERNPKMSENVRKKSLKLSSTTKSHTGPLGHARTSWPWVIPSISICSSLSITWSPAPSWSAVYWPKQRRWLSVITVALHPPPRSPGRVKVAVEEYCSLLLRTPLKTFPIRIDYIGWSINGNPLCQIHANQIKIPRVRLCWESTVFSEWYFWPKARGKSAPVHKLNMPW